MSQETMPRIANVCVYCGSASGADPAFEQAAVILGRALAAADVGLVYGGGGRGLMGKLAHTVLDAGGRIYLGKDSYTDAATFRTMYPAVDGWLETKAKYDPNHVFTSNLARRVGLA